MLRTSVSKWNCQAAIKILKEPACRRVFRMECFLNFESSSDLAGISSMGADIRLYIVPMLSPPGHPSCRSALVPHWWEPNVTATNSGRPLSHYRLSSHKEGSHLETKHDMISWQVNMIKLHSTYCTLQAMLSNGTPFFQHLLLISVGLGNSPHVRFTALGSLGQFPTVVAGSCACLTQTPRYTKVK